MATPHPVPFEDDASSGERYDTTHFVRLALQGDVDSWTWIVERLSPLLHLQARYRLRGRLRRLYDPEDLVNEVWAVAFARSSDFKPRDERWTPVLMQFLSRTLLHKTNDLVKKHIVRAARKRDLAMRCEEGNERCEQWPADTTSILSRASRSEVRRAIESALMQLAPADQEVLVLSGVEGLPAARVAEQLGQKRTTVAMRYRRALGKLRQHLPPSLFSDLFA